MVFQKGKKRSLENLKKIEEKTGAIDEAALEMALLSAYPLKKNLTDAKALREENISLQNYLPEKIYGAIYTIHT